MELMNYRKIPLKVFISMEGEGVIGILTFKGA